jgi:hypothetical protein
MEIRLTKLEAIVPTLATREDLAVLENKVFGAIHKLETTIHQEMGCMHKEMSSMHKEISGIHKAIVTLTWRLVTTMIGLSSALATSAFFIGRYVN